MPTSDLLPHWGRRLAEHRKAAGLTQEALGDLVGVTGAHISKLESGQHEPPIALRLRLAAAVNAPASTLFPYELPGDAA